jgi:hypothetical protein
MSREIDQEIEEAIDLMDGGLGVSIRFREDARPDVGLTVWNWAPLQRLRVIATIRRMLATSRLSLEPHGQSGLYHVTDARR